MVLMSLFAGHEQRKRNAFKDGNLTKSDSSLGAISISSSLVLSHFSLTLCDPVDCSP